MQSLRALTLLASGFVYSANAASIHARHQEFHAKRLQPDGYAPAPSGYAPSGIAPSGYAASSGYPAPSSNSSCGCTTYLSIWYGQGGLVPAPAPTTYATNTSSETYIPSTSSEVAYTTSSSSSVYVAPTSYPTPIISSSSSSSSVEIAPTSYVASTASDIPTPSTTSEYVPPPPPKTTSSSGEIVTSYVPPTSSESSSQWIPEYTSTSSSATPSASSGGDSGSIVPNGNQWAMTYTPYADDGSCKSADQVSSDIAVIASKGFTTVRLYATDCSGPQNIGSACAANGLKMVLGIYVDETGIGANTEEQVSDLIAWGSDQWGLVEMVVAGNEAVFNGYLSADQLAGFIHDTKTKFQAAGYTGPVTTTEPLGTIQENSAAICGAVDVIAANIHPFFNADVTAEKAGEFVASQLSDLAECCDNKKEAYNLETGWPTEGSPNGDAVPGYAEQKAAIEAILADAGAKSVLFSYLDDMWKSPGDLGVEQYWGCSKLFAE